MKSVLVSSNTDTDSERKSYSLYQSYDHKFSDAYNMILELENIGWVLLNFWAAKEKFFLKYKACIRLMILQVYTLMLVSLLKCHSFLLISILVLSMQLTLILNRNLAGLMKQVINTITIRLSSLQAFSMLMLLIKSSGARQQTIRASRLMPTNGKTMAWSLI